VDERLAVWLEATRDAPQQLLPVAHVLEHLDGDDAVEAAPRVEVVDVGGDDLEPAEAAAVALGLDPGAL